MRLFTFVYPLMSLIRRLNSCCQRISESISKKDVHVQILLKPQRIYCEAIAFDLSINCCNLSSCQISC